MIKMLNKKGRSEVKTIIGIIVFFIVLIIFATQGVFSAIIKAFSSPILGSLGTLLGVLFILIIIITLLKKILEK